MAGIPPIRHEGGLLYRDLTTGQFLPWETAKVYVEYYRYQGLKSAALGVSEGKAVDTFRDLYGLEQEQAEDAFRRFRAAIGTWQQEGGENERPTSEAFV